MKRWSSFNIKSISDEENEKKKSIGESFPMHTLTVLHFDCTLKRQTEMTKALLHYANDEWSDSDSDSDNPRLNTLNVIDIF